MRILSVLLLISAVGCSTMKKDSVPRVNGKRFSYYMEIPTDQRSPASSRGIASGVGPGLRSLVRYFNPQKAVDAEKAILNDISGLLGRTVKSLDEVKKAEEGVLDKLYYRILEAPTSFYKNIDFSDAIAAQAKAEGYVSYIQDAVKADGISRNARKLNKFLADKSDYTLKMVGKVIDKMGPSIKPTLERLASGVKNNVGTLKAKYIGLYENALINGSKFGVVVPGEKCSLVETRFDEVQELQRSVPEVEIMLKDDPNRWSEAVSEGQEVTERQRRFRGLATRFKAFLGKVQDKVDAYRQADDSLAALGKNGDGICNRSLRL